MALREHVAGVSGDRRGCQCLESCPVCMRVCLCADTHTPSAKRPHRAAGRHWEGHGACVPQTSTGSDWSLGLGKTLSASHGEGSVLTTPPPPPSLPPPLRSGNLLEAAGLVSGRARIQTRDSAHLPYSHAQQLLRARERLGSSRPVLIGGAGVWEGQVTVASESQLAEVQRSPLRPVPAHPGCAENGRIAPRTAFPGHGAASALKRSHSPLRDAVAG